MIDTAGSEPHLLDWLQRWYVSNCDGDWEHQEGVHIDTLDNPGGSVKISLACTPLESEQFERVEDHHNEDDWLVCWVEADHFQIACGPLNLTQALTVFRNWDEAVSQQQPS